VKELTDSYKGIMVILRHFISKDKYTENHCYRVSQYAARIAVELGLAPSRVEDVRAAVLLHDIGKLEVSRQISARSRVCKARSGRGIPPERRLSVECCRYAPSARLALAGRGMSKTPESTSARTDHGTCLPQNP